MNEKLTPEQVRNMDALKRIGYYASKAVEQFAVASLEAAGVMERFVAAWKKTETKPPAEEPDQLHQQ